MLKQNLSFNVTPIMKRTQLTAIWALVCALFGHYAVSKRMAVVGGGDFSG
jgi:ABC-type Mn2+/Zn2+ transport system permease subunit